MTVTTGTVQPAPTIMPAAASRRTKPALLGMLFPPTSVQYSISWMTLQRYQASHTHLQAAPLVITRISNSWKVSGFLHSTESALRAAQWKPVAQVRKRRMQRAYGQLPIRETVDHLRSNGELHGDGEPNSERTNYVRGLPGRAWLHSSPSVCIFNAGSMRTQFRPVRA